MKNVFGALALAALCASLAIAAEPARAAVTDTTLVTPTGTLYGTMTLPDGATGPVPVALIIAGSGPFDRDGNSLPNVTAAPYRLLAEALATRGIATVRYDKRGVAASRASGAVPASGPTFTGYVDDAIGWLAQLRTDKRFSRVTLVGHSEGALIALLAATRAPADGVVSIAGAGRPIGDLLVEQVSAQGPVAQPLIEPLRAALAAAKVGHVPTNVPEPLKSLFLPMNATFLQQWMNVDPAAVARTLSAPLAIVQGLADIQITEQDARLLAAANPRAVLTLVPHMTHMLKDARDGSRTASLATYSDATGPLDPLAVDAIFTGIAK